jgi:hypothetical protein
VDEKERCRPGVEAEVDVDVDLESNADTLVDVDFGYVECWLDELRWVVGSGVGDRGSRERKRERERERELYVSERKLQLWTVVATTTPVAAGIKLLMDFSCFPGNVAAGRRHFQSSR